MSERVVEKSWKLTLGKLWLGYEYSPIRLQETGEMYMERWIVYLLWINLRLHKIHRGDDLRALHDHPFHFITFPLKSYVERYWSGWSEEGRNVKAFRFHRRAATFRHAIIGRTDGRTEPFYTLVIATTRIRSWGFWPFPNFFVYYKDWRAWKAANKVQGG